MSNYTTDNSNWSSSFEFIDDQPNSNIHLQVLANEKEFQYWRMSFKYEYKGNDCVKVSVEGKQDREYRYRASNCAISVKPFDLKRSRAMFSEGSPVNVSLTDENYNNFQTQFVISSCPWGSFMKISVTFSRKTIGISKTSVISYDSLKTMMENGVLTDFTIKTKLRDIPCHKVVLADRSEYFRTMFETPMKENEECALHWENVYDETTVQDLLHYVYTGKKPPQIRVTCFRLIQASHFCLLDDLKELCIIEILKAMTKENVVEILIMGDKYESGDLKEEALNFVIRHGKLGGDPSELNGWNDMEPAMMKSVMMSIVKIIGRKKIRV